MNHLASNRSYSVKYSATYDVSSKGSMKGYIIILIMHNVELGLSNKNLDI